MKKLITILFVSFSLASFSQGDSVILGRTNSGIGGKRFYKSRMYYQYPLYPANGSTVALDTVYSWDVARLLDTSGQINYIPLMYENEGYNKTSVMKFKSGFFLTLQDSVWSGDTAYIASGSIGFGSNAIRENKGVYATALGSEAARYNTGNYVTAVGWGALRLNTANYNVATGHLSGAYNTGSLNTFYGFYNSFENTGSNVASYGAYATNSSSSSSIAAIGSYAMQYSKDADFSVFAGYASGHYNVGATSTGIGSYALRYNNSPDRIAIGYNAANDNFAAASVKSFVSADISIDSNIAIPSHGFGTVGTFVNLRYNYISGTTLVGMSDGGMYQFRIKSADTLVLNVASITNVGSGSFTLSIDTDKSRSSAIGYRAYNTRTDQISLGNPSYSKEVRLYGKVVMDSLSLTSSGSTNDVMTKNALGYGVWAAPAAVTPDTTTANTGVTTLYRNGLKLNVADPTYTGRLVGTGTTQTGSGSTGALSIAQTLNTSANTNMAVLNLTNTASGSGSTILALQVGGTNTFFFRPTGFLGIGQGSAGIFPADPASPNAALISSGSLRLASTNTAVGFDYILRNNSVTSTAQTSGANGQLYMPTGFAPTSGTGTWAGITLQGTINQTGGASGITRSFWANQTVTAAADYRAFEANNSTGYSFYSGAAAKVYFNGLTGIGAVPVTDKLEVTGNLALMTAGNKIKIATGSNASVGTSTLVAGTVTVSTTAAATASKIFVTVVTPGGTQGFLSVPTIVNGTSFTINSTSATETSTVNWWIVN